MNAIASRYVPLFRAEGFASAPRFERDVPISGPLGPLEEARRGRARCGFFDKAARAGTFSVRGADRAKVLHGQCTQDVKGAAVGAGGAAWLLDARGANHGPLRFSILEDEIVCETETGILEAVAARIMKFVITEDARVVVPSPPPSILHVVGPEAQPALSAALGLSALPASEYDAFVVVRRDVRHVVVRDDGFGGGYDVRLDGDGPAVSAAAAALVEGLRARGAEPIGDDAAEILRVIAGRPRYGVDCGQDATPAETGTLERTTSFTKGCYAGQEVVAKQQYLGRPRKALVRLVSIAPDPRPAAPGAKLFRADGAEAGRVTSCVEHPDGGFVALGTVKPEFDRPGESFKSEDGGGFAVGGRTAT